MEPSVTYATLALYLERFEEAARENVLHFRCGALAPTPEELAFMVWQLREHLGDGELMREDESCGIPESGVLQFWNNLPDEALSVEALIQQNVHGRHQAPPLLSAPRDPTLVCDLVATTEGMAFVQSLYADQFRRVRTR